MEIHGNNGNHFLLACTHRRVAAALPLPQRLQKFLVDHQFDSLESIAVADLRGLGLTAADAATVYAACAAASLSSSRHVAAVHFSSVSPSSLRLPFASPPWRLFFRASSLISSLPSHYAVHSKLQSQHQQQQESQRRQHKQLKQEHEHANQKQERRRQQERELARGSDAYEQEGDPNHSEGGTVVAARAATAASAREVAAGRATAAKDRGACEACCFSWQRLPQQPLTHNSNSRCMSDSSCSRDERASSSETEPATETDSTGEDAETEVGAAAAAATAEEKSREFQDFWCPQQQHCPNDSVPGGDIIGSNASIDHVPALHGRSLGAEKAYATHSNHSKKCRSICHSSTKGDTGSSSTTERSSGCNIRCSGKRSSSRRKNSNSSGKTRNTRLGKSSAGVVRERSTKIRRRRSSSSSSSDSSSGGGSKNSSEGSELLRLLSQPRSRESTWCWSSGSAALDQLLGGGGAPGQGWRRRDVVEIYGPGGGATLTEVLLTCLVESLFASQRAKVLLLSFRGGLPLRRLQQLLRHKVVHRMQQRQHHRQRQQQKQQQQPEDPRQQHQERIHQQQQQHLQRQAAEEAELFVSTAERRVQRLLRRVHVAHCFTLEDFGEALNQAEDVFAAGTTERKACRAAAAELDSSAAAASQALPHPGGEKSTAGARHTFSEKRRYDRGSCRSTRCSSPSPPGAREPCFVATVAADSCFPPTPSCPPSACAFTCSEIKRGSEHPAQRERQENLSSCTGTPCRRRVRKKKRRYDMFCRGSSSSSYFLAAAAVDGLPLVLLPFALLEGNAVLQQVCLRLRTFADACNALVLMTNHGVAGGDSAAAAVTAASAAAAAPDCFSAAALRCRVSACSPRFPQPLRQRHRDGDQHVTAAEAEKEEEGATTAVQPLTAETARCARCQLLSSSAAPLKPALGTSWSRTASQVKLQVELIEVLCLSPLAVSDARCWETRQGHFNKLIQQQQQRQPPSGLQAQALQGSMELCDTFSPSYLPYSPAADAEGFLLRITLVKSPWQAPGPSAGVLLTKQGLLDLACSCATLMTHSSASQPATSGSCTSSY